MSYLKVKNRAESTLASGINDAVTELTVAAGEGANFPTASFNITIDDEILFCSSRSTDVFTVVRAQEGTTEAAHDADAVVELRITAGIIENLERGCGQINVETLTDAKTLTPGTDEMYQYLDEGGANRIITLATTGAKAGDRFIIRHNGLSNDTHYLEIKQGATVLNQIYAEVVSAFIFDGTNWISVSNGSGGDTLSEDGTNVALGTKALAYEGGVAVGKSAQAKTNGAGVGATSNGGNYGASLGASADSYYNGVALGYNSDTNTKPFSVALGYRSETERVSEIAHNINGDDSDQENNIIIIGLEKQTANATPIEMLCGGQSAQRITIRPSSVLVFKILISARDNVSGDCAAYKVEGAIKRDASNNTAMLAAASITVIHEDDATWDVAVAADDTNEALVITVTGDDTNITQWVARLDGVETHF